MLTFLTILPFISPGLPAEKYSLLQLRFEMERFPTTQECTVQIGRADKHLAWIDIQLRLYRADKDAWLEYREQVAQWKAVWEALRLAKTGNTIPQDRPRMDLVREAVGEENYRKGFIYPPIAPWFTKSGFAPN